MIPRRVWFAILMACLCHGFFILTARYRLSYDAYTHMLFADHYANNWFSLWSTRWYAGFEIVSYPPLIHQLIAIFIPIVGFDAAYALILWLVTTFYPLGIYAFSRIFSGKIASSYAALASAIMLPIYVTAHIFGQLPFLGATLFALFGAAAIAKFLREGGVYNFFLATSLIATTMAAHHATLLAQPFLLFSLSVFHLNKHNWKATLSRLAIFLVFAIPAGIIVIWPFWQWGMYQQMQIPIDHLSRHNFFIDPIAIMIFFLPFYFPIGAIIPFIFYKWPRKFLGLQLAFIILFIIGLGGTTPLPSLIFGKNWEWLTYDRFAFWTSLILTPFFGILFIKFKKWMKNRIILNRIPASLRGTLISILTFSVFACSALGSWLAPILFPTQPLPVDMSPIVKFLNEDDHSQWRYLTFGFGNQYTYLNLLTKTTTIDGSYHTARTLPELRQSGIAEIDTAYWTSKGIQAIAPVLQVSGEYGVRWGFVNRRDYVPELKKDGWTFVKYLPNGIQVWENPNVTFNSSIIPPENEFTSFSWGIFPLLSLLVTLALGLVNAWPLIGERIIRKIYVVVIGIVPLSLGLWYYKTIFEFKHEYVSFPYTNALFFLSDSLACAAVLLWLVIKLHKNMRPKTHPAHKWLAALCGWITCSALWAVDWRVSITIAAHFWLVFLLILSLQDWHEAGRSLIIGFCIAAASQACIGIIELTTQSTHFLEPLKLTWPGNLTSSIRGASILKYASGENFLRVYGTFPHPNILGGFILVSIMAATAWILLSNKKIIIAYILLGINTSLIAVVFSRSAWLGLITFFIVLFLRKKSFAIQKLTLAAAIVMVTFIAMLFPYYELFISRTTPPVTDIEKNSIAGRVWFAQRALEDIAKNPLMGLGAGSFTINLAEKINTPEPVHNIPLLVLAELGVIGFTAFTGFTIVLARSFLHTNQPGAIIISALLCGLGVIALLDHYLWTLAPGRILLGLVLGLGLGQLQKDAE